MVSQEQLCFPQCMGKRGNLTAGPDPPDVTSLQVHGPPCVTCSSRSPTVSRFLQVHVPHCVTFLQIHVPHCVTFLQVHGPPARSHQWTAEFPFHSSGKGRTNVMTQRLYSTVQSTQSLLLSEDELTRANPRHPKDLQVFTSAPPTVIKGQPATKCQFPVTSTFKSIIKSSGQSSVPPECYSEAASYTKIVTRLQGANKCKKYYIPLQDIVRNLLNTILNTFSNVQSSIRSETGIVVPRPQTVSRFYKSTSPNCVTFLQVHVYPACSPPPLPCSNWTHLSGQRLESWSPVLKLCHVSTSPRPQLCHVSTSPRLPCLQSSASTVL